MKAGISVISVALPPFPLPTLSFNFAKRIMSRKYVRKLGSVKGIRDDRALANAVEAVRTGRLSLRQAQKEFGVKKDRISRTLRGKHLKKYGGHWSDDPDSRGRRDPG